MAKTNLFMNWSSVIFTPSGGSPLTLVNVVNVRPVRGFTKRKWSADVSKYATLILLKDNERTVTIDSGDIAGLAAIPIETIGTLVCVLNDAKNGTGTGAVTITLVNAQVCSNPFQGQHNQYGTGSLEFEGYSTDGVTDPMTITQA